MQGLDYIFFSSYLSWFQQQQQNNIWNKCSDIVNFCKLQDIVYSMLYIYVMVNSQWVVNLVSLANSVLGI